MRLDGKSAIVTGAGQGIGEAIARRLAAEGARVAVLDVDLARATRVTESLKAAGGASIPVRADISQSSDVDAVFGDVVRQFGSLDILVNNAGITRDSSIRKMTDEQWESVMRVNLFGTFYCCRAAARHMVEQRKGWGRIVSISSRAYLGQFGQVNYAASKAGIVSMTRTLALELGRSAITVNAIAPGFIETEMSNQIPAEIAAKYKEAIPLQRAAQPSEVASAVAFLASDDASYITGQTIFVCGGRSLYSAPM